MEPEGYSPLLRDVVDRSKTMTKLLHEIEARYPQELKLVTRIKHDVEDLRTRAKEEIVTRNERWLARQDRERERKVALAEEERTFIGSWFNTPAVATGTTHAQSAEEATTVVNFLEQLPETAQTDPVSDVPQPAPFAIEEVLRRNPPPGSYPSS
jgi:hypothetical protein